MFGHALVALVAAIHLGVAYLEMVAWDTPLGHRIFKNAAEFARATKVLAFNQGLYNLFLAAGLIWGLFAVAAAFQIKVFFLLCVAIAGVVGAVTAFPKILLIQTVPAVLALLALWLGW